MRATDADAACTAMSPIEQALALARYARQRIHEELGGPSAQAPDAPWARAPGATFVSLHWLDGRLQGCIGSLEARRPIAVDVALNALGAAFRDPRARPLLGDDVDRLTVEVSILSPREVVAAGEDEAVVCAMLRPGTDGIVLRWQEHHATFLPQVWTHLPDPARFLAELKEKAGLPADFWAADLVLERYTVCCATDRRSGEDDVARRR